MYKYTTFQIIGICPCKSIYVIGDYLIMLKDYLLIKSYFNNFSNHLRNMLMPLIYSPYCILKFSRIYNTDLSQLLIFNLRKTNKI